MSFSSVSDEYPDQSSIDIKNRICFICSKSPLLQQHLQKAVSVGSVQSIWVEYYICAPYPWSCWTYWLCVRWALDWLIEISATLIESTSFNHLQTSSQQRNQLNNKTIFQRQDKLPKEPDPIHAAPANDLLRQLSIISDIKFWLVIYTNSPSLKARSWIFSIAFSKARQSLMSLSQKAMEVRSPSLCRRYPRIDGTKYLRSSIRNHIDAIIHTDQDIFIFRLKIA